MVIVELSPRLYHMIFIFRIFLVVIELIELNWDESEAPQQLQIGPCGKITAVLSQVGCSEVYNIVLERSKDCLLETPD